MKTLTSMTFEWIASVSAFAFVTSVTPGPNNSMLLASGVNYGVRATIPHILGISLGFAIMLVCVALGIAAAFATFPAFQRTISIAGAIYLLYLSWKIASAGPSEHKINADKPLTFFQAAAFQWVNPKSWIIATGAASLFLPPSNILQSVVTLVIVFISVGIPCTAIWATLGALIKNFLNSPVRLKIFNVTMGMVLALSVVSFLKME